MGVVATAFAVFDSIKKLNEFSKTHSIITWQESVAVVDGVEASWITVQYYPEDDD